MELEMHREKTIWDELTQKFKVTFTFEHKYPSIDATLKDNRTKVFSEEGLMEVVLVCDAHRVAMIVHELLDCYNIEKEEHDEEDPKNVKLP
jgi:hypothetical protein